MIRQRRIREAIMSKLAKKPIPLPEGVTAEEKDSKLVLKGVKGELTLKVPYGIDVGREDSAIKVRGSESRIVGLFASLVRNGISGVSGGFGKKLELVGVGYKAQATGDLLKLSLGFSHPVEYKAPEGVKLSTEGPTVIVVGGIDKQKVGQVAAEIRGLRLPEPYKGKGIRYLGEVVRRKSGKAVKAGAS